MTRSPGSESRASGRRRGGRARQAWRLFLLSKLFGFGSLLALRILVGPDTRRDRRKRSAIAGWWERLSWPILGLDVTVRGEPLEGAGLLVANHVSWLDIVAIGGTVPADFVSKAEVRRWPLIGWLAAAGGTLFIPRGGGRAGDVSEAMADKLRDGLRVLVFPEGTTTDGAATKRFFPRLFGGAIAAGAPVQPVVVRYPYREAVHPVAPFIGDETFPRHLLRVLAERRIAVELTFCRPLASSGLDRRTLAERSRAVIDGELTRGAADRGSGRNEVGEPW